MAARSAPGPLKKIDTIGQNLRIACDILQPKNIPQNLRQLYASERGRSRVENMDKLIKEIIRLLREAGPDVLETIYYILIG